MEKEKPVLALGFLGVGKTVSEIQCEKCPSALSVPSSSAWSLENKNFPPVAMSLKTRESSAMSLKRIFDQINSSTGCSVQPVGSASDAATLHLLERKDEEVKCEWHLQMNSADGPTRGNSYTKPPAEVVENDAVLNLQGQTRAIGSPWKPIADRERYVLSVRNFIETIADEDRNADGGGSSVEVPPSMHLTKCPAALRSGESSLNVESPFGFPTPERKSSPPRHVLLSGQTAFGSPIAKSFRGVHQKFSSEMAHKPTSPVQGLHTQHPSMGLPSRTTGTTGNQLTIFYAGMVNVYDDVPSDKAHAIMLIAGRGSPHVRNAVTNNNANGHSIGSSQPRPFTPTTLSTAATATTTRDVVYPSLSNASALCLQSTPVGGIPSTTVSTEIYKHPPLGRSHTDLPVARKASLARFLEKRKDRTQSKLPINEVKNKDGNETEEILDGSPSLGEQGIPKKLCNRSQSPT